MVLDEDRFEEQFLRCSICKDRFATDRLPRLLPCHHSFCQTCVFQLFEAAKQQRIQLQAASRTLTTHLSTVSISCPSCRANYIATEDSVRKLPADHRVVQLMDFVHHTERYTVTFCSKHNLQPLNFFCEPCVKPVCRDCTVLDHKDGEGHLVMDLEEAMAKYTPVLDAAISEMEAEAASVEEKRVVLESVSQTLDNVREDLLDNVRSCMSRLRLLIDEREKVLELKVHQETEKEKAKLNEKTGMLMMRRKVVDVQAGRLKQAKEECNVEDMFRVHQEVKEYRVSPPLRIREVDDGIMTTLQISTRDEPMLASRINNFGDVTSKVETTNSRAKSGLKSFSFISGGASLR